MHCPFCTSGETQVLESRIVEDGRSVRRRRECTKCTKRFTTYEKVEGTVLWVIKKDGGREPFDREKIRRGIVRAIHKRPISLEQVEYIISEVEREMLNKEKQEIPSKSVGQAVLKKLKKIDRVAWLRFASVYLEFEDLKDFAKAIKE